MRRFFGFIAAACCLAAGWSSVGLSQEPAKSPTAGELRDLQDAIVERAYITTLLDLGDSLIADNALGIDVALPDAALRAQLNLGDDWGLVVTAAPAESPGAKAGLRVHDVLVQFGDQKLGAADKLKEWLGASEGKAVKLRVLRGGKPIEVEVTPKQPEAARLHVRWAARDLLLAEAERYRIGVTLSEADDTLRAHLRLAAGEGLVVTEVVKDSAASAAGIRVNDVFTVLDGKRLTTVEAINAQIQEIKDRAVDLRLLRGGEEVIVRISPRKTPEAAFVDRPVTLWDVKSCTRCHGNPWGNEVPHLQLSELLGAHTSVWTDGHKATLYARQYLDIVDAKTAGSKSPAAPQQQIEALKGQLAEMQKTLSALETSLAAAADKAKQDDRPKEQPGEKK